MKRFLEYCAVCGMGGVGYGGLEIAFRGRTHWSMLAAGGACFSLMYAIAGMKGQRLWQKWVMSAFVITAVEFVTGAVVNLRLGWNVWDYSHRPANLMGQICLLFSALWLLLSIPGTGLCLLMRRRLFKRSS